MDKRIRARAVGIYCVLAVALTPVLVLAGPFEDGEDAYNRGDFASAARSWLLAAELGDVEAQYNLGLLYVDGQGVPQDNVEAAEWWRLAAEQGYAHAQHNLGVMYAKGQGVPQDNAEAAKWRRRAAAPR